MARFGKLLAVALVTGLGFAGSALYGSASHVATLQDLIRATGGTCYAVYNDSTICATSKSVCVSDGDGTYTYWEYIGASIPRRTTSWVGNTGYETFQADGAGK